MHTCFMESYVIPTRVLFSSMLAGRGLLFFPDLELDPDALLASLLFALLDLLPFFFSMVYSV